MIRLKTTGLKARDLDLTLGPRVLITGPNSAGKTTVLDALCVAALGWVPRLGRTPAATAALMSGREMTVRLEIGERWIERVIRQKGRGYETTTRVSWSESSRSEEHEAEALALFGATPTEVEQTLDISELLRLSGNQRAAAIQPLLEQGVDPDAITRQVARRWMQILAAVDNERMEHIEAAAGREAERTGGSREEVIKGHLRPQIEGYGGESGPHTGVYARLREVAGQLVAKVAELSIGGALAWANEEKNRAAGDIKPKLLAREELSARIREIPEPDTDEMARLEEQRAGLDRQIGAAREREAATGRQAAALRTAQDGLELAEHRLAKATREREQFEGDAGELGTWRAQRESIRAELEALVPPPAPDFTAAEQQEGETARAEAQARAIEIPAAVDLAPQRAAVTQAEAALKVAAESPWARVAGIARLTRENVHRGAKGRPTLIADVDQAMAELVELAVEYGGGDVVALSRAVDEATAALAEAQGAAERAAGDRERKVADRQALLQAAQAARAAAQDLRAGRTETYNTERALFAHRREELTAEAKRLDGLLAGLTERDTATAEAVRAATEALGAARIRLGDLRTTTTGAVDDAPVAPPAADLTAERARLTEQLGAMQRARATHDEFTRLVAEIDRLRASEIVFKALEQSLQHVRAEEIAHGGGRFVGIIATGLAAAGRHEAPYIRAERGVCDLGWRRPDTREVKIDTLCGAEYTLFAGLLTQAVSVLRAAPVKLLLLEAGEAVDHPRGPQSMTQLLNGVGAIADEMTACVIVTPHEPAAPVDGWQVVRLEAVEPAAVAA